MENLHMSEIIMPTWLLWIFPQTWIFLFPITLTADFLVLLLALRWMRCSYRKQFLWHVWWKVWLLGLVADFFGFAWMFLGALIALGHSNSEQGHGWHNAMEHIMHKPYGNWQVFLWTLAAVVISGILIYRFNRRMLRRNPFLREYQNQKISVTLAIFTAPWLFFLPAFK